MENKSAPPVLLDKAWVPDFYEEFRCAGSDCKNTCCKNWNIWVNRSDYSKIRAAHKSPEFQSKVEQFMQRQKTTDPKQYAKVVFKEDGYCPLLSPEGLCQLQIDCGFSVLPSVCRSFPRISMPTPHHFDKGFSVDCEVVIRLLAERKDGISFHEIPLPREEWKRVTVTEEVLAEPVYRYWDEIRAICIGILQNRSYSMEDRLVLLGVALRDLDAIQRERKIEEMPEWLRRKRLLMEGDGMKDSLAKLKGDSRISALLNTMIIDTIRLTPFPSKVLKTVMERMKMQTTEEGANRTTSCNMEAYLELRRQYQEAFSQYDYLMENVLVNAFFSRGEPFRFGRDRVWDNYMVLCMQYSLNRFLLVGALTPEMGLDEWIDVLVDGERAASAAWMGDTIRKFLSGREQQSLAYMALIVKG